MFTPYLFFSNGECRAAFTRYQEIFGGELQIMTNGDAPPGDRMEGVPDDVVMHAALHLGDAGLLGSDDPSGDGGPRVGSAVSYTGPDEASARRAFEALAEGGEVTMPFSPVFWAAGFGMCTDRWGVPWMVSTPH